MADTAALLQDVLARLDALERDNAEFKQDNALLKAQNDALLARAASQSVSAGTPDEGQGSPLERMSRRWMLRRGAQMAAASVAAGVLLHSDGTTARAGADTFDHVNANSVNISRSADDKSGLSVWTSGTNYAAIYSLNSGGGISLWARSPSGNAAAVLGESAGDGVAGSTTTDWYSGVYGKSNAAAGYGVTGDGKGASGAGVLGRNVAGDGVRGEGAVGVKGTSSRDNYTGVVGEHTGSVGYGVLGIGKGSGVGVTGRNSSATGVGVRGEAAANVGVLGEGAVGVKGTTTKSNYAAVAGDHLGSVGYGVSGVGTGAAAGVLGRNPAGEGVRGEGSIGVSGVGTDGWGVKGEGDVGVVGYSARTGHEGVYGGHTGAAGYGVVGDGSTGGAGVLGRDPGGDGVRAEGRNGVVAKASGTAGYGAVIQGGKAQLRIVPKTTTGAPMAASGAHQKGEVYMDSAGTVFICTAAGTPGAWRKVNTTAV